MKYIEKPIELIISRCKWLQVPVYIGLIATMGLYIWNFCKMVIHLFGEHQDENQFMLATLTIVDTAMVIWLIYMVTHGSYVTFVSKIDEPGEKLDWLDHVTAGSLKAKLASSLVTISGIHLLQSFLKMEDMELSKIYAQMAIHLVFLVSAVALAWVEKKTSHR